MISPISPNFVTVAALASQGVPLNPVVVETAPLRGTPSTRRPDQARKRSRAPWSVPVKHVNQDFPDRWPTWTGRSPTESQAEASPESASDREVGTAVSQTASPGVPD